MQTVELQWVLTVQEKLSPWDDLFQTVTDWSNPHNLLLFVCPVVFWTHLRQRGDFGGLGAVLVSIFADWFNAVLKFIMMGDRPYWVDSRVRQFPHTCESGYGMPSGHAMVSSGLLFYLIFSYGGDHKRMLAVLGTVLAIAIAISRVHTGSHFPSQVLLGNIVAISLVAIATYKHQLQKWLGKVHGQGATQILILAFGAAGLCYGIVLFELYSIEAVGVDPLLSISHARRGCNSLEAVQRTTSPMKGIARVAGICTGAGIGIAMRLWQAPIGTSAASNALSRSRHLQHMEALAGAATMQMVDMILSDLAKQYAEQEVLFSFVNFTVLYTVAAWVIPAISEATVGTKWCLSKVQKYC